MTLLRLVSRREASIKHMQLDSRPALGTLSLSARLLHLYDADLDDEQRKRQIKGSN